MTMVPEMPDPHWDCRVWSVDVWTGSSPFDLRPWGSAGPHPRRRDRR